MPGTSEKGESTCLANVVVSMRRGNFSISQMKNWLVLWLQVLGNKTSDNWNYHPSYTSNYVPTFFVFWSPFCDIMTLAGTNTWVIRLYRMPDPWVELDVVCCQLRPGGEGQSCVTPNIIRRTAHKDLETVLYFCHSLGVLFWSQSYATLKIFEGSCFWEVDIWKGKELSVCLILELIRGGFIFVVESKAGRKLHSCLWQCQKLRKISCMCSLWMNS